MLRTPDSKQLKQGGIMKNIILLIAFATPFLLLSAEYDTLTLQQGLNGYSGCVDVGTMNDQGTKLFGWKIGTGGQTIPVANYRC